MKLIKTTVNTYLEKQLQEGVTIVKTSKLIEMLAATELKEGYIFSPAEITRAFVETNCKPFSRSDVDFIKACLQSESLKTLSENWQKHAREKNIELAKMEVKTYNFLREKIKAQFNGLIFYKD